MRGIILELKLLSVDIDDIKRALYQKIQPLALNRVGFARYPQHPRFGAGGFIIYEIRINKTHRR